MHVLKVMVMREEDGAVLTFDAIEHEQNLWLVPEWLRGPTEGTTCPARMICLNDLSIDKPGSRYAGIDWVLLTPLSRFILDGTKVTRKPRVLEKPDIVLRADRDLPT
jgi:hypothetical protein